MSAPVSMAASAMLERARAATPPGENDIVFVDIPPAHIPVLNAFYRRRQPFCTTIAGRQVSISLAWRPFEEHAAKSRRLLLRIDGEDAELSLARSLLDLLIASVDPRLSLDRLQPDHAALVMEFALAETLAGLEASLGLDLAVVSILPPRSKPESAGQPAWTFGLTVEGLGSLTCELRLSLDQAIKVTQHLDQYSQAAQASINVPMIVCLRQAAVTLPVNEIRSLSPGDVILVDQVCQPEGTVIAVIAEHLVVPVELSASGGLLSSYPIRRQGSPWEWSMEKEHDAVRKSAPDASDIDDLPVRLVFEVGRLELSLSEIRRLAPGAILPLMRPLDAALDIVANGRRIGSGTIVRIGDAVGVRVTRLLENA